jgi:hypothetical protein
MLWLVFRGALVTKVKLSSWGYGRDILCSFCYAEQESVKHLFFHYSFSRRVWMAVMNDCRVSNPVVEWYDVVNWSVINFTGSSLWENLCRLCLGASVYHLWKLRNDLCHGNTHRTEEDVVKQIKWEVRSRIMAKGGFTKTGQNAALVHLWNL